jgi:hypothetical protein
MKLPAVLCLSIAVLTACSPSSNSGQQQEAQSGKWPPADYKKFESRPPMSVGAELQDPWTLAIDAERWSYRIGKAIEVVGDQPAPELPPARPDDLLVRAHVGQRNAATRLLQLVQLACTRSIAKPADCSGFHPPAWVTSAQAPSPVPPVDELMQRNIWFTSGAEQFILTACARATVPAGEQGPCTAE